MPPCTSYSPNITVCEFLLCPLTPFQTIFLPPLNANFLYNHSLCHYFSLLQNNRPLSHSTSPKVTPNSNYTVLNYIPSLDSDSQGHTTLLAQLLYIVQYTLHAMCSQSDCTAILLPKMGTHVNKAYTLLPISKLNIFFNTITRTHIISSPQKPTMYDMCIQHDYNSSQLHQMVKYITNSNTPLLLSINNTSIKTNTITTASISLKIRQTLHFMCAQPAHTVHQMITDTKRTSPSSSTQKISHSSPTLTVHAQLSGTK
jgi:hypothetical protein